MRKTILLAFLWSSPLTFIYGQGTPQYQYWLRYQQQIFFKPFLYLNNEFDNRRFFVHDIENQFICHSYLNYKRARWQFGGGLTTSWTFASQPEKSRSYSTMELRPVVEASHEIPLRKWSLQNRIRLDNRFIEVDEDHSIFEKSQYILRARYRLQLRVPLKPSPDGPSTVNLKISDELFLNDRKNTFDQNRVATSIDFYVNKKFTLEAQHIYTYQQRFGRDEFVTRHAVRFTLLHRIILY